MRTLAAATCLTLSAISAAPLAAAQGAEPVISALEGTMLTIAADARASAEPDIATVQVGVTAEGQTAAAALADNGRRMNQVMAALKQAGVAERDIQTSQLSVSPQYAYADGAAPRLTGYQAQNMVSAKVRRMDTVGRVVDAAVGQGGNQLQGVSFSLADPDTVLDAARKEALRKARARANVYAEAAGMRVHRILQIQEGGAYAPQPMPVFAMARMAADESTPVAPGEVELTATVNVVFELR